MNNRIRLVLAALLVALIASFAGTAAADDDDEKRRLDKLPVSGTLADGGTFKGNVTITEMGYDQVKGLTVSGQLKGTATGADGRSRKVNQKFADVEATLNETSSAAGARRTPGVAAVVAQQTSCDILFLDLGPLSLDLLGLTVDLSQIVLDINAVPGAGNLLGNLLCAVAGLLDPGGLLGDLIGALQSLLFILNAINDILG